MNPAKCNLPKMRLDTSWHFFFFTAKVLEREGTHLHFASKTDNHTLSSVTRRVFVSRKCSSGAFVQPRNLIILFLVLRTPLRAQTLFQSSYHGNYGALKGTLMGNSSRGLALATHEQLYIQYL